MSIGKRQFKLSAFLASLFFIFTIVLGIYKFEQVLLGGGLPTTSIINISADICSMALGYVLFICSVIDKSKNEENLNYYLLLLFTAFCGSFLDEVCWLVDGDVAQIQVNSVANALYYMCAPCLAFLFWRYVITYLNLEHRLLKVFNTFLACGLVTAVVVRIVNLTYGFYYTISPDGVYTRGDWYILSNIYAYVTMILTLLLVFLARKRFKKHQVVILYLYAFFPLAIGILAVFTYGLSLTSPVIMLVLLLMYCVLNVFQSRERSISENELAMANSIQENMLPHIFPAYPDRKEFDLYASMTAAKEVGGDFYDFYMPDSDHLVLTIADVSGKGIPAALMMMVTKTLIKNRGLTDFDDCSKILSTVNDQLCEGNELGMFVTVWIAVLTISTGELRYSNAGHEYPAIKKKDGKFELIKERHSPPLGCMEGIPYKEKQMTLQPGDMIYVYTDGVTEATNSKNELFGETRMLESLNRPYEGDVSALDRNVKDDIDKFIDGAQQFDDITMLCMKYNGPENKLETGINYMKQLTVKADISQLDQVLSFADGILEEIDCPMKTQMQLDIAIEELFVNIANYAYPDGEGNAVIEVEADSSTKSVQIVFEDEGIPYNPLEKEDPDISLSAEDRPIGGLGIFMVKKSVDDMSYEYKDGKNRLTIKKSF